MAKARRNRRRAATATMVLLIPVLVGQGCPNTAADVGSLPPQVQSVSPAEAHALIRQRAGDPDFIILDVRSPEEYAAGHMDGAVLRCLLCTASFADTIQDLDRTKTYLVYCRSGNRSATASRIMAEQGFTRIYNMTGGLTQWQAEGYPVVR